ncbi:MAG: Sec-independent protein translocase TatB [Cellulomonas sp.]|nr:Sec-independent protein translocase TatB [Cellulomonas sp.]
MINGYELVALLIIIAVVVGPERLPAYAKDLATLVRRGRELLRDTQDRVSAELGDAGEEIDWASLDPRRYDPRRIVRDALRDDDPRRIVRDALRDDDPPRERPSTAAARRVAARRARTESGAEPDRAGEPDQRGADRSSAAPPVFDDEAT